MRRNADLEQRNKDFVAKSIRAWEDDRERHKRHQSPRPAYRRRSRGSSILRQGYGFVALIVLMGLAGQHFLPELATSAPRLVSDNKDTAGGAGVRKTASRSFPICGSGKRINCVVDGDTFWVDGEKIRIADINAPEVSSPKCGAEKSRGDRATRRLRDLLNAGAFEMQGGDTDRYGRSLRTLHRNGRSIGGTMVEEGLAHDWNGYKENWCG